MVPVVSGGLLIAARGGTLTVVNSKILAANRMVTVFLSNIFTFCVACVAFCAMVDMKVVFLETVFR